MKCSISYSVTLGVMLALLASVAKAQETQQEIEKQLVSHLGLPALPSWSPTPVPDPGPQSVPTGSLRRQEGLFECPCSPTNRSGSLPEKEVAQVRKALEKVGGLEALSQDPSPQVLAKILKNLVDLKTGIQAFKRVLTQCREVHRIEGCVNADAKLRGKVDPPLCTFDSATARNIVRAVTVGSCAADARFNLTTMQLRGESQSQSQPADEGYVAIEHLEGHVLQHPEHLLRPVLCAHGFCATRNHAIIVDGEYSSMGYKCGNEWRCMERLILVNNLKVAVNRRTRVNENIVVTLYDIRFPKAAVWAVQIFEDVINMLAFSVTYGTIVSAFLVLYQVYASENIKE